MGTITAKSLCVKVAKSLNDTTNVRWAMGELLEYLNHGQREIGIYRPDAITVTESLGLATGSEQTLPAAGIRFVDVLHNAGAAPGTTIGTSVTLVDREQLDLSAGRSWRSAAPANDVDHVVFDGRYPTKYYVYPPANAGRFLMIAYQKAPADCTINGVNGGVADSVITLNDIYETALMEYMFHRAYLKDSEVRDTMKGAAHYNLFLQRIDVKTKVDKQNDPNRNAPPVQQSRQVGGVSQRAQSY